jgi:hypothetical protein
MARHRERRYCVWCPREVKGLLEVFLDGTWMPVCTVCYLARRNQVARSLAEIDTGKRYAFRWNIGAPSGCGVRASKGEPLALPLFPESEA